MKKKYELDEEKNDNSFSLFEIIQKNIKKSKNSYNSKEKCVYLKDEEITSLELGNLIGKKSSDIAGFFWKKGLVINMNNNLSEELIKDYCDSLNISIKKEEKLNFNNLIEEYLKTSNEKEGKINRTPVVSIMGHIDHGKTTLLDTIRGTKIQEKEEGGITQKISVCQIDYKENKITFLDTPGHSDFIKMRHKGISLTDVVVLVIDAKDGVMSQTEEIIDYLKEFKIFVLVFINHKKRLETDNENNLNRIRTQLQNKGLNPLEWGGDVIVLSGDARDKENSEELIENILLISDFKLEKNSDSNGVVIDSYVDRNGQLVSELMIKSGKLEINDFLFINGDFGKIKNIDDIDNKKVKSAFSGQVIKVIGLKLSVELGDRFLVINEEKLRERIIGEINENISNKKNDINSSFLLKQEKKVKNIVLLANSQNSIEALIELVKKKKTNDFAFNVVKSIVGNLSDSLIETIRITESKILSFGVKFNKNLINNLKESNIEFFNSGVIYEIDNEIDKIINESKEKETFEEIVGEAEIIQTFYFSKTGKIAGFRVLKGTVSRNNNFHVFRKNEKLFTGKIESLQSNKLNIKEVKAGQECGAVFRGFEGFQEGDKIIAFKLQEK